MDLQCLVSDGLCKKNHTDLKFTNYDKKNIIFTKTKFRINTGIPDSKLLRLLLY